MLELGWLRTRASDDANEPTTHLVALPGGARVPRAVTRVTGIRQDDLAEAGDEVAVWNALLAEATADTGPGSATPTVVHYAQFERAFFRDLHARLTPARRRLPFDIVCTHRVARRLLPELPRRSLRALAGYYGFNVELLRRCAGHVAATAHVWRHLVVALGERGIRDWATLHDWLSETPAPSSKRVYPMARDKRLSLPDRPGVYRMLRTNGDVLYVGKATSLKKRVNSYFTKRKGVNERALEMLTQARDLDVTPTATALEAALLETDEIKRHQPPYNVHLREDRRDVWFVSRDMSSTATEPDAKHALGPFPSRRSLSALSAIGEELVGPVGADPGRAAVKRRARAIGAAPAFAPDSEPFRDGLAIYRRRWLDPSVRDPLRRIMTASKHMWRLLLAGDLQLDSDPEEDPDRGWDPERVARHLARVTVQSGQLLRRSRWLCVLSDAAIAWQEPSHMDEGRRLLLFGEGEIVEQGYLAGEAPLPGRARRDVREVQAAFDIARYDRLRVVSTELKRVAVQGEAMVRTSSGAVIAGAKLARLLEWV
jgi:DNA polymerase III subunit epsilon